MIESLWIRISWDVIQCFVSWLVPSRLQHPLGHQLLLPSRVDSTNAAEGAISAGWAALRSWELCIAEAPTHQDVVFRCFQVKLGSIASGGWAGVFWNRHDFWHHHTSLFLNILNLSKPSLLNFQRHFPGEHWATPSHRGWVWHITGTWGVPTMKESHQGFL